MESLVEYRTTGNSNARLLAADSLTRVRFVPNPGFRGQVKMAFVAWDQTTGTNGSVMNVGTRGGSTSFSLAYEYASLDVTNVAPILNTAGIRPLIPSRRILQMLRMWGTLVSDVIARMAPAGGISDADPGALPGIAIVG